MKKGSIQASESGHRHRNLRETGPLAGCPGAALAAGQGWSLSVGADKSQEAVRPLYRNLTVSGVSIIANLMKATVLLRGPGEVQGGLAHGGLVDQGVQRKE